MVANGKLPRGQTKVTFQTGETRSLSFCGFVCNWSWPSIHLTLSKFRSRIFFLLICDFSLMQLKSLGAKPSMMNYWAVRIMKKKQTNTSTTKLDDVSINLRECIPFSTVSLTNYAKSWVLDIVWLFGGFQQRRCESAVGRLTPFSFFLSFSESCASVVPPSCGQQQTSEREITKV